MIKKKVLTLCLIAASTMSATAQSLPTYLDETKPIEQRVEDALSRMTLDEKIAVIHAQSKFSSPGVKRLGLPDFWTDDGPHGVRPGCALGRVGTGRTDQRLVCSFPCTHLSGSIMESADGSPLWCKPR